MSNKLNKLISGTVEEITRDGLGVIKRPIGKPYLISQTIVGEEVSALTHKRTKDDFLSELQEIIKSSPHRVEPRCPMFGKCGGCKWQHIERKFQLELKKQMVEKTLGFSVEKIVSGDSDYFYRNRMDFMFGWRGELGLKEAGKWWSVVDLPKCFLQSEESNKILKRVGEWSKNSGLPFWDNKKQTGFFRALVIREGKNTGERLVMLVTADDEVGVRASTHAARRGDPLRSSLHPRGDALLLGRRGTIWEEKFIQLFDDDIATSVLHGICRRTTDLSIADEIIPLKGETWLNEEINGLKYRIAPNSFFQTNSEMAAELQNTVMEFVAPEPGQKIADLYCGAGFFSLAFARAGAEVVGVEMDEAGIEAARINAELNKISADFTAAKIEDYFKNKSLAAGFDTIVLDPPRAGLHPKVLKTLLEVLPPKIVYISCGYHNLAKEFPEFLKHYKITRIRALDLFPQTPHVEVVVEMGLEM